MLEFDKHLLTIKEASVWATNHLGKNVTTSNISYLIQYGRIRKVDKNGSTLVSIAELNDYYKSYNGSREIIYKEKLGNDLNWALSFDQYKAEASELGMNAIGMDISAFNALIGNSKIAKYDILEIEKEIFGITNALLNFIGKTNTTEFGKHILTIHIMKKNIIIKYRSIIGVWSGVGRMATLIEYSKRLSKTSVFGKATLDLWGKNGF